METIKDIGLIASCIVGIISVCGVVIRPLRNKIINSITKISGINETEKIITELKSFFENSFTDMKEDIKYLKSESCLNRDANKCILANKLTEIYERWHKEDAIDLFEKDSLEEHFRIYKALGGNGKIEFRYKELMRKDTK